MTLPGDVDYGYGSWYTRLTWEQLAQKQTWAKLDPEFRRRFKAMVDEATRQGVRLGVGTGWRIQPNPPPPGFAKPGNSNHEGFMDDEAVAIDTVPSESWTWMEANCQRFGLRTFRDVNNEPWHVQPNDIPASRNWRTLPWDLARITLPDLNTDDWPPFSPAMGRFSLWPYAQNKPVLRQGNRGDAVRYLKGVLKKNGYTIKVTPLFTKRTKLLVRKVQKSNRLEVDGVVGKKTWYVIDKMSG